MHDRKLGRDGPGVFPVGLGCMSLGLADVYTSSVKSTQEAISLIHRALDLGITLLDTADCYGISETQVGKALKGRREQVVLATKFGFRSGSGTAQVTAPVMTIDGSVQHVRNACDASLKRLGVDHIDLYYLHRVDPNTPIEETTGAMAALVREGKVRYIGLSEPSAATIRRALKVHPLAAIQTEYSLFSREPEEELLPLLKANSIALVAYSPLGRGFLAGRFRRFEELAASDGRRNTPRFQRGNFEKNLQVADRLREIAAHKGCTVAQLSLAWLLARPDNIIPIPGTSSVHRLEENVGAVTVSLTQDELAWIDEIVPHGAVTGSRYGDAMMQLVNG